MKPAPLEESELVYRCRHGDRRAQEVLFRNYGQPMYHVVLRMTGDPMESEEIVQEAFIRVFSKIRQFEGRSTLGAWIKRVVVNQALNQLKKKSMRWESIEDHEVVEEEKEPIPGITPEMVRVAIQELPKRARLIVSLHLIEEYKHTEIAELLGIGESTSRSQYMRGQMMLREILKEQLSHERL